MADTELTYLINLIKSANDFPQASNAPVAVLTPAAAAVPMKALDVIWLIKLASSQDGKVRVWLENPPAEVMAALVINGLARAEPNLQVNRSPSCTTCSASCHSCSSWSITPLGREICAKK